MGSKKRIQKPDDETLDGNGFKINANDPAFNIYWNNKSSEVRAMAEQFGSPDLIITFTFNNKWSEVDEFRPLNWWKNPPCRNNTPIINYSKSSEWKVKDIVEPFNKLINNTIITIIH